MLRERGYIAPVKVLVKMEVVSPSAYEIWRVGIVPYLEKFTACSLGKLDTTTSGFSSALTALRENIFSKNPS